jgi:hypothetical protein
MYDGFWKYDLTNFKVDLLILKDLNFFYPASDANVLENVDSYVDDGGFTWTLWGLHFMNKIIMKQHSLSEFVSFRWTKRARLRRGAIWIRNDIRGILSLFLPSLRYTRGGRSDGRECRWDGALLSSGWGRSNIPLRLRRLPRCPRTDMFFFGFVPLDWRWGNHYRKVQEVPVSLNCLLFAGWTFARHGTLQVP